MTLIAHLFILTSYVLASLAVALGLPDVMPGVGQFMAYLIGGMVFVGCALLHEVLYRRSERLDLVEDVHDLREALAQTAFEVRSLSEEASSVHVLLEQAEAREVRQSELIAEMRVLQTLLGQIADTRVVGRRAQLRAVAGGRPAAAPPASPPSRQPGEVIALHGPHSHEGGAPAQTAKFLTHDEVHGILAHALQENRVDLYLQPVVSLPQRKVRFYEAFSRIRDANGAIIAPEQYLPVAEETGLITTIDNLLLFRCVQLIRRVRKRRMDVGFFVNVSSRTLDDTFFFTQFIEFMEKNQELADHLIFEIGQDALRQLGSGVEDSLMQLAEMGFRLSIDQVTSLDLDLADLARRRVGYIKVEAERLITDLGGNRLPISVYKLKGDLARTGIDLIAEKVESEAVVTELVDYSVDFGQGYLFGEPRPAR